MKYIKLLILPVILLSLTSCPKDYILEDGVVNILNNTEDTVFVATYPNDQSSIANEPVYEFATKFIKNELDHTRLYPNKILKESVWL